MRLKTERSSHVARAAALYRPIVSNGHRKTPVSHPVVTARSHGGPIRVLLVDDHEHVLWGLSKLIDGEWPRMMVIGISRDMAQAKALIDDRRPDVIVLDVYVGGSNALDCMPELLSGACTDVIVHTSVRDEGVRRRAMEVGARCVVDKEAPAETLLREIVRVHGERLARNATP